MQGPRAVAAALEEHLADLLPGELARLDDEIGLCVAEADVGEGYDVTLLDPTPQLYAGYALPPLEQGVDAWPMVVIVVQNMSEQRRLDVLDDGSFVYERKYPTRIFGFARGDGYLFTAALRDRLILGITETLLRHQTFGLGSARITEADLIEDYSSVDFSDDLAATVGGGYVQTTVVLRELLAPVTPALSGPIEDVEIDTPRLADHPALD